MKTITVYEAEDGRRFDDAQKCERYDRALAAARQAESKLNGHPQGADSTNGSGYVQQDAEVVKSVKNDLVRIAAGYHDPELFGSVLNTPTEQIHPRGYFARMLDESESPVQDSWWRIGCIDDKFREWGQWYYAINSGTGKDVAL